MRSTSFETLSSTAAIISSRAPGERRDVTVVDQAESVLERIVVWPTLIISAHVAGLFADRTRAEPSAGAVRGASIERHAVDRTSTPSRSCTLGARQNVVKP